MNKEILIKLSKTPNKIGCYLLKNRENEVIYIGKSINIAKRIKTHLFRPQNRSALAMAKQTTNWDFFLTNIEKEAFILEQNLIKKYLPRYNVILKDDRRYPYIYISSKNKNPRYYLIYLPKKMVGDFYGPFPDQYSGKQLLNLLENLFPLKKCRLEKENKPCIYYQIGQCLGGCWKKIPLEVYQKQLKNIKKFFQGKIAFATKNLNQKIKIASANMQFEQAGRWKKTRDNLINFVGKQIVEFNDYLNRDFIQYYQINDHILIQVFFYRVGKLQMQTHFWTKLYNDNCNETIENYLQSMYLNHILPNELIINRDLKLTNFQNLHPQLKIVKPQRGKKLHILQLMFENCQSKIQNYLHQSPKSQQKTIALQALKVMLKLKKLNTIDFIDLSYLNKDNLVIGVVNRFLNGWEIKNQHRYFIWKDNQNWSEKEFFAEIVTKTYEKIENQPDLLLVDGGFLQLKGTKNALKDKLYRFEICGLIKNDKHETKSLLLSNHQKKSLPAGSDLLMFLRYLQECGHLNAIRYFKKLKVKTDLTK